MNFIERIFAIQKYYSITQKVFSEKTGVSRSYLSEIKNMRSGPSVQLIVGIANSFPEINLRWLLTGEGSMFEGEKSNRVAEKAVKYGQATPEVERIIHKLLRTPVQKRGAILKILEGLIEL